MAASLLNVAWVLLLLSGLAATHVSTPAGAAAPLRKKAVATWKSKCTPRGAPLRGRVAKQPFCPKPKPKPKPKPRPSVTNARLSARSPAPRIVRSGGESLSNDYYANTCPQVESIIHNKVIEWIKIDLSLAASLLRLHFHDCTATGCDASILLADPKGRSTEMYSVFSKGLRGFEVVDNIKMAVERECPGVVSCADILTTIARDVVLEMGGPFWFVPFGRKDSPTSYIKDAEQVPHQESDANTLLEQYGAMGLSFVDLATLSGAHSVGRAHCFSFTGSGARGANPAMNRTYAHFLRQECKDGGGPWAPVYNDPVTPYVVDLQYYTNLKQGMGLFKSDQTLIADNDMTSSMVDAFLSQPGMWESQFAVSMVNLGNVNVIAGNQGEVRRICSRPNPPPRRPRRGHR